MPIYEYSCNACHRDFETLVRTDSVPDCPGCGSTDLAKKLSVFATASSPDEGLRSAIGPCGSCGHPDGPGACAFK